MNAFAVLKLMQQHEKRYRPVWICHVIRVPHEVRQRVAYRSDSVGDAAATLDLASDARESRDTRDEGCERFFEPDDLVVGSMVPEPANASREIVDELPVVANGTGHLIGS